MLLLIDGEFGKFEKGRWVVYGKSIGTLASLSDINIEDLKNRVERIEWSLKNNTTFFGV